MCHKIVSYPGQDPDRAERRCYTSVTLSDSDQLSVTGSFQRAATWYQEPYVLLLKHGWAVMLEHCNWFPSFWSISLKLFTLSCPPAVLFVHANVEVRLRGCHFLFEFVWIWCWNLPIWVKSTQQLWKRRHRVRINSRTLWGENCCHCILWLLSQTSRRRRNRSRIGTIPAHLRPKSSRWKIKGMKWDSGRPSYVKSDTFISTSTQGCVSTMTSRCGSWQVDECYDSSSKRGDGLCVYIIGGSGAQIQSKLNVPKWLNS